MNNIKISNKLIFSSLLIGLVSIFIVGLYSYLIFRSKSNIDTINDLQYIKQTKKLEIEDFFSNCFNDLETISQINPIISLNNDLLQYKNSINFQNSDHFYTYTDEFENIYNKYDSRIKNLITKHNYKNLFLVSNEGQIMYSVNKSKELGENLKVGRLINSPLAFLWKLIYTSKKPETTDFLPYSINNNKLNAFMGIPIFDDNGEQKSCLILQIDKNIFDSFISFDNNNKSTKCYYIFANNQLHSSSCLISAKSQTTLNSLINDNKLSDNDTTINYSDTNTENLIAAYTTIKIKKLRWKLLITSNKIDSSEWNNLLLYGIIIITIILLPLIFIFAYFISKSFTIPIQRINNFLIKLNKGIYPHKILPLDQNKEISEINVKLNNLTNSLKQTAKFASEIGNNELETEFILLSKNDELGNSLIEMQKNLLNARKKEAKRKIESNLRNWATEGQSLFADIMRQNSGNLFELADNIIKNLVSYLGANQGGLFLINDDENNGKNIQLFASYAYDRKKHIDYKLKFGEGLIGTCAIEKQIIYITNIPDEYLKITSGLGDSLPKSLLVVPFIHNDNLLAIIEIASFNEFEKHEIEFVKKIGENVASTITNTTINTQTAKLLVESQEQAENLSSQEEEMRQNIEEMQATREEAFRREFELNTMLSAIDQSLIRAEYDINGILLDANHAYLEIFEYQLSEIKGKNIEMFIPNNELNIFRKSWQDVCNEKPFEGNFKRITKSGKTIWLSISYSSIKNENDHVTKILNLAFNITKEKEFQNKLKKSTTELLSLETELKAKEKQYTAKYNELKNSYNNLDKLLHRIELKPDFSFIKTNDVFLTAIGYSQKNINNINFLTLVNTNKKRTFENLWQNVCNGNSVKSIIHLTSNLREKVSLEAYLSPIMQKNKVISVDIIAKDIGKLNTLEDKIIKLQENYDTQKASNKELYLQNTNIKEKINLRQQEFQEKINNLKQEYKYNLEEKITEIAQLKNDIIITHEDNKKLKETTSKLSKKEENNIVNKYKPKSEIEQLYNDWLNRL